MPVEQPTPAAPRPPTPPEEAGYVPAFSGADGQEDPAPEAVVSSIAIPVTTGPVDGAGSSEASDDGRFEIAEEVSTDLQSDQARRVGRMPSSADDGGPAGIPDPAETLVDATTGKALGPASGAS